MISQVTFTPVGQLSNHVMTKKGQVFPDWTAFTELSPI